jgi:Sec-independent protein translocase protein TatA
MAIFLPSLIGFLGTSPGSLEIFVLFVAVVLLFGARSLPGFARQFGRIMEELRKASWDFKRQMMDADYEIRQATAEVSKDLKDLTNLEASGEGHGSDPADGDDYDADYTDDQGDEYHDYHADDPEAEGADTPTESVSQDDILSPEDDVLPQADKPEPGGESTVARGAVAAEALPGPAVADDAELPTHPNVADQASEKDPPTHG